MYTSILLLISHYTLLLSLIFVKFMVVKLFKKKIRNILKTSNQVGIKCQIIGIKLLTFKKHNYVSIEHYVLH